MHDYPLLDRQKKLVPFDVEFDYDNRPGIYVNHHCIGGAGGSGDDGTPETHPWGFRKGAVIRDNHVFNSGRCRDRAPATRWHRPSGRARDPRVLWAAAHWPAPCSR